MSETVLRGGFPDPQFLPNTPWSGLNQALEPTDDQQN